MAKRIVDEEIKFSIIVNGNEAQKELFDLEKSTRKLTEENKKLLLEKKYLQDQGLKETEAFKKLSTAIRNNSTEINANKKRMAELQKEIGITGLTMSQLTSKSGQLKMILRNLLPGSADYEKYDKQLKRVTDRMNELSGKAKQAKFSLSGIADGFNKYAALGASFLAMLTGIVLSVQKVIDMNGKLSDAMSNVSKTTGMNRREVDELAKSFGMLKTRTTRIELLGIAEIGGRLGIAKNEIGDFVRVMDKAGVALGDSFEGGASVVAEKLGGIKGLYKELRDEHVEKVFESVGSALNDLGADGIASEQNVAAFVTRVGAMPEAFKPAIAEALGLGAAFEESGLKAELASTNYSKVITLAANNVEGFAKVMRKPTKEIEDLINTKPTEFFLRFANSLKSLKGTDLAKTLDFLKLNDNEVKMVLGAASKNTDMFRQKIDMAAASMKDATSLTLEFNTKNNNLAATLEKISKTVTGWLTSETFTEWLAAAVDWISKFIGATADADGSVGRWKNGLIFLIKILAVAISSVFSYKAGLQLVALWSNNVATATALSNIVFKIQYGWLVAQEIATKALAFAQSFLTLKISEVRKAFVALTATMNLNPYAALIGLIVACTAAYIAFSESASETNEVMKAQVQIANRMLEITGQQKQKVTDLVAVLKDENATIEQKKLALAELKKITNGYLESLTAENVQTAEGIRLINRYIAAIDELAKAKAIVEVKSKLNMSKLESDNKILALSIEKKGTKNEGSNFGGSDGKLFGLGSRNKQEIQLEIEEAKKERELVNYQLQAIEQQKTAEINRLRNSIARRTADLNKVAQDTQKSKELAQDIKSDEEALNTLLGLSNNTGRTPDEISAVPVDGDDDKAAKKEESERKKREALAKKRLDELKKADQNILKYKREAEDAMIAALEEGYEKERLIEQIAYERKLEDLQSNLHSQAELKKLDVEIDKAAASGDTEKYNFLKSLKEKWLEENYRLNLAMQSAQQIHNIKIGIIEENGAQDSIEKLNEKFNREKTIRETEFNKQLAQVKTLEQAKDLLKDSLSASELRKIKTLDDAKKALQEDFNKKELEKQSAFLKFLLEKLDQILTSKQFEGIDLDLLSPEAKKRFEIQIEQARKLKSELDLALSGKGNKTNRSPEEQEAQVRKEKGLLESLDNGGTDVLGFTPEQWDQAFNNMDTIWGKMAAGIMVAQALQSAWGSYVSYVEASENASLRNYEKNNNTKKKRLKQQLDAGIISQALYTKQVEKLDLELEKQKAEIEYKQAKRKKAMSIVDTVVNTAVAIMQAYSQLGPIGGTIAAVIIGTLGALQIATIAKQPLPARGYETGLYPIQREQDGKIFNAGYGGETKSGVVNKPTYFLTGENGPEMILDNKVYSGMNPEVRNALHREIARIKGYEFGLYPSKTPTPQFDSPNSTAPVSQNDQLLEMAMRIMGECTEVLKDLRDNPIIAVVKSNDYRSMKELQAGIEKYNDLINKTKK